ncbi:hypothetical protein C8R43DRAFT_907124 [Mycena crocata]|nr:hypothetical protein C8R43DRAFT_907124 [Mycena crocata]
MVCVQKPNWTRLIQRQPPRAQAKVFQVLIKTHKLTVLTTVVPTITVAALKDDVLSALSSDVNTVEGVPPITSADDFELCKGVKAQGKLTGEFQPLNDLTQSIKEAGVTNYEALFVQFRDPDSRKCSLHLHSNFLIYFFCPDPIYRIVLSRALYSGQRPSCRFCPL